MNVSTTVPAVSARTSLRRLGALGALLIAAVFGVLLTASAPASAKPYPPYPAKIGDCTVSTTTANAGPGSHVTFVGSGFKPNTTVTISVPSASAALGGAKTTASGSFTATFTWPASVAGASAVVQASAVNDTCSFTLVNHKTSSTNVHRAGGSGLSSTGFAALTATTIALVLVGSGAIFLGLARRRKRA